MNRRTIERGMNEGALWGGWGQVGGGGLGGLEYWMGRVGERRWTDGQIELGCEVTATCWSFCMTFLKVGCSCLGTAPSMAASLDSVLSFCMHVNAA